MSLSPLITDSPYKSYDENKRSHENRKECVPQAKNGSDCDSPLTPNKSTTGKARKERIDKPNTHHKYETDGEANCDIPNGYAIEFFVDPRLARVETLIVRAEQTAKFVTNCKKLKCFLIAARECHELINTSHDEVWDEFRDAVVKSKVSILKKIWTERQVSHDDNTTTLEALWEKYCRRNMTQSCGREDLERPPRFDEDGSGGTGGGSGGGSSNGPGKKQKRGDGTPASKQTEKSSGKASGGSVTSHSFSANEPIDRAPSPASVPERVKPRGRPGRSYSDYWDQESFDPWSGLPPSRNSVRRSYSDRVVGCPSPSPNPESIPKLIDQARSSKAKSPTSEPVDRARNPVSVPGRVKPRGRPGRSYSDYWDEESFDPWSGLPTGYKRSSTRLDQKKVTPEHRLRSIWRKKVASTSTVKKEIRSNRGDQTVATEDPTVRASNRDVERA